MDGDLMIVLDHFPYGGSSVLYDCINQKLKYVLIREFTGKEQEVKSAKHLIANANMIEKMSIICDETKSLLSLSRVLVYLSITLEYKMKNQLVDVV
ncbi:hypothetical protein HKD37_12G034274 [Glycine soja]